MVSLPLKLYTKTRAPGLRGKNRQVKRRGSMVACLSQTAAQRSTWLDLPPLARPKTPALKPKLTIEINISEFQRTRHLTDLP